MGITGYGKFNYYNQFQQNKPNNGTKATKSANMTGVYYASGANSASMASGTVEQLRFTDNSQVPNAISQLMDLLQPAFLITSSISTCRQEINRSQQMYNSLNDDNDPSGMERIRLKAELNRLNNQLEEYIKQRDSLKVQCETIKKQALDYINSHKEAESYRSYVTGFQLFND